MEKLPSALQCVGLSTVITYYHGLLATSWLVYNLYVRFTAGVVLSCPVVPASASRSRGNQALGRAILFLLLPPWLHCDAGTRALSLATPRWIVSIGCAAPVPHNNAAAEQTDTNPFIIMAIGL